MYRNCRGGQVVSSHSAGDSLALVLATRRSYGVCAVRPVVMVAVLHSRRWALVVKAMREGVEARPLLEDVP